MLPFLRIAELRLRLNLTGNCFLLSILFPMHFIVASLILGLVCEEQGRRVLAPATFHTQILIVVTAGFQRALRLLKLVVFIFNSLLVVCSGFLDERADRIYLLAGTRVGIN